MRERREGGDRKMRRIESLNIARLKKLKTSRNCTQKNVMTLRFFKH